MVNINTVTFQAPTEIYDSVVRTGTQ